MCAVVRDAAYHMTFAVQIILASRLDTMPTHPAMVPVLAYYALDHLVFNLKQMIETKLAI